MAVPFVSEGYGASITESHLAVAQKHYGARFGLETEGSWKVAATATGANRSITIAPGVGFGDFIRDTTTLTDTYSLDAATGTDRWDLIACRRNWAPEPGGTTTFVVIKGSTTSAVFNPRPIGFTNSPGVTTSDQPLALCRVKLNQALVQEVVDLRCTTSKINRYKDVRALPPDAEIGSVAKVDSTIYDFIPNAQGVPVWTSAKLRHWGWYWGGASGYGPVGIQTGTPTTVPGSSRVINVVAGRLYRIHSTNFNVTAFAVHNVNFRVVLTVNDLVIGEVSGVTSDVVANTSGAAYAPISVTQSWVSTITGPVTVATRFASGFAATASQGIRVRNLFSSPLTEVTELGDYEII